MNLYDLRQLTTFARIPQMAVKASARITEIFNENVFTLKIARHYLSDEAYKSLLASTLGGKKIDRQMGNHIANGLKAWAEEKGVTHFTTGFSHSPVFQQKNMIHFLH